MTLLFQFLLHILASPITALTPPYYPIPSCRCFPSDPCWPTPKQWSTFNKTLNGRLIDPTPIGSICHHPTFNTSQCAALQTTYHDPLTHFTHPSSIMAPYWANNSCDAFAPPTSPCNKGTYIDHAVRVSTIADITHTLDFARTHNIRIVIRNTGHDYLGKSTGAGSLALWMHHLQNFSVLDYTSSFYTGKAVKISAGMLSVDATAKAHSHGLVIVGGNCPTVGLAGGYTQGGGLGPLTSRYGFAADQVLEWHVVTVDGRFVVATPENEGDLYWALSGGGGGTFAVVVDVVVRAYKEERSAAANLTFASEGVGEEKFYGAVEAFHGVLPRLGELGGTAVYVVLKTGFAMVPAMLPGMGKERIDEVLEPVLLKLREFGIKYEYASIETPSYYEAYKLMNAASETSYFQIGGRVLPPQVLTSNCGKLTQAFREINNHGAGIGGLSFQAPQLGNNCSLNSINPGLRNGRLSVTIGTVWNNTNWDQNLANQALMTDTLIPIIDRLAPGQSTAYLNEADFRERRWQKVFYGESYRRLLRVKRKYDPENVLWARTGVGSEAWAERKSGILCRTTVV